MSIEIKKPVIVTALYDIGRDKWEKFTQSYGGYMHWFWRTLSLDSEIVIYTQERFNNEILDYRKKYDPEMKKTVIVNQELEELESYKIYNERLEKLMYSETFKNKVYCKVTFNICFLFFYYNLFLNSIYLGGHKLCLPRKNVLNFSFQFLPTTNY